MTIVCGFCYDSAAEETYSKCSKCTRCFHFQCSRVESRETWVKKNKDTRDKWKCDLCMEKQAQDALNTKLSSEIENLKKITTQNAKDIKDGNKKVESKIDNLTAEIAKLTTVLTQIASKEMTHIKVPQNDSEDLVDEKSEVKETTIMKSQTSIRKLPRYIENEMGKIPKLWPDQPWSIINFIDGLYLINEIDKDLFPDIFKRTAAIQHNALLRRLASSEELTFLSVSRSLIEELTTQSTKIMFISKKVLRPQGKFEAFRSFTEEIIKFSKILTDFSESEILDAILRNVNDVTRARCLFQNRPNTLQNLQELVSEVEKSEMMNRNYKNNQNHFSRPNYSQSNNKFHSSYNNYYSQRESFADKGKRSYRHENNRFDRDSGSYTPVKQQTLRYRHTRENINENPSNQNSSTVTKRSFKQNNPTWNRKFQHSPHKEKICCMHIDYNKDSLPIVHQPNKKQDNDRKLNLNLKDKNVNRSKNE